MSLIFIKLGTISLFNGQKIIYNNVYRYDNELKEKLNDEVEIYYNGEIPIFDKMENNQNGLVIFDDLILDNNKAIDAELPKNMAPTNNMVKIEKPEKLYFNGIQEIDFKQFDQHMLQRFPQIVYKPPAN